MMNPLNPSVQALCFTQAESQHSAPAFAYQPCSSATLLSQVRAVQDLTAVGVEVEPFKHRMGTDMNGLPIYAEDCEC